MTAGEPTSPRADASAGSLRGDDASATKSAGATRADAAGATRADDASATKSAGAKRADEGGASRVDDSRDQGRPSIGRGAFWGGLIAGGLIASLGFFLIPELGLSGILTLPLEIAAVFAALQVTTRIWRHSAQGHRAGVDTSDVDRDRGRE